MKIGLIVIFCFSYALLNVTGAAIIKSLLKVQKLDDFSSWLNFLLNFKVVGAFALIFVSALVMFKALSYGNFSIVVPVATGINFLLTVIIGYFFFHDKITLYSIFGFVLILFGIAILSLNNNQHAQ